MKGSTGAACSGLGAARRCLPGWPLEVVRRIGCRETGSVGRLRRRELCCKALLEGMVGGCVRVFLVECLVE